MHSNEMTTNERHHKLNVTISQVYAETRSYLI